MSNELVVLQTFINSVDANMAKALLDDNNIQSAIFDENMNTAMPIYNNATGGIRLMVKYEDYEQALKIVNPEKAATEFEKVVCPSCRSENIIEKTKTDYLQIVFAMLVTLIPGKKPKRKFVCNICKHNWVK